jgi:hypothetical protein
MERSRFTGSVGQPEAKLPGTGLRTIDGISTPRIGVTGQLARAANFRMARLSGRNRRAHLRGLAF